MCRGLFVFLFLACIDPVKTGLFGLLARAQVFLKFFSSLPKYSVKREVPDNRSDETFPKLPGRNSAAAQFLLQSKGSPVASPNVYLSIVSLKAKE
jgi:hypothetical protein